MTPWLSVAYDVRPARNVPVLLWLDDGATVRGAIVGCWDGGAWNAGSLTKPKRVLCVTHWAPITEPAK